MASRSRLRARFLICPTVALVLLGSGCSTTGSNTAKPTAKAADTSVDAAALKAGTSSPPPVEPAPGATLIATARVAEVAIRAKPGAGKTKTFANPTAIGSPLTFMVLEERPKWLRVQLPARPNGSSGWVSESDVTVSSTTFRLVISKSKHRLSVLRDGNRIAEHPVGIGKVATPTPKGTYYLTELIESPNPKGGYGPYAFGLSAYSTTLKSYGGGPGQIGLHGTDAPHGLGKNVSHGCLRLANSVITKLAHELPLGTPVEIGA